METFNRFVLVLLLIEIIKIGTCLEEAELQYKITEGNTTGMRSACGDMVDERNEHKYPEESFLRNALMSEYDYNLRPVMNASTVTRVAVSLSSLHVLAMVVPFFL